MSDFIFSSRQYNSGDLSKNLLKIHADTVVTTKEYIGQWGTLAFITNHYNGYSSFENDRYILIVLGGPVLKFHSNVCEKFEGNYNTFRIFDLWKNEGEMQWDKHLSGPFSIICIDKDEQKLEIITDLMSFIPIYKTTKIGTSDEIIIGSHIDIIANVSNRNDNFDLVSIADTFINRSICYPYTVYKGIFQLAPASINTIDIRTMQENTSFYWMPKEEGMKKDFNETVLELRSLLTKSIEDICRESNSIGILMSGGEDSRAILSSIPKHSRVTGHIFVDLPNREMKIAQKVARVHNINLKVGYRSNSHYIDQLKECTKLIGSQHEFIHVHSYKFHEEFKLNEFDVVLGGLFSDALFKGSRINTLNKKVEFLPDKVDFNHEKVKFKRDNYRLFKEEILKEVSERREKHKSFIKQIRPISFHEWYQLWPATMLNSIANISGNRRLFKSYEPFLDNEIVKLSAVTPQQWKLNRKLFHNATKPFLKETWYIPHSTGMFPYAGYSVNVPLKFLTKTLRYVLESKINHSPWPIWKNVVDSKESLHQINKLKGKESEIYNIFNEKVKNQLNNNLDPIQILLLLQLNSIDN